MIMSITVFWHMLLCRLAERCTNISEEPAVSIFMVEDSEKVKVNVSLKKVVKAHRAVRCQGSHIF
jgi:hypothetical protein